MFSPRTLNSVIALAGCLIVSAAGLPAATMPPASGSHFERHVIVAPPHAPRLLRLAGPVIAPVGEGWG